MDATQGINQVIQQYGGATVQVLRQIAEYLQILQQERPDLFDDGVLVEDWIERLQQEPLSPEVLPAVELIQEPAPMQKPGVVMPAVDFTSIAVKLREFGGDAAVVVRKVILFLSSLQDKRPDLFENGRLVDNWVIRLQSEPLPVQILPEYDPVLIPVEEPKPEPEPEPEPPPPPKPEPAPVLPTDEPTREEMMRYEIARIRSAANALSVLLG